MGTGLFESILHYIVGRFEWYFHIKKEIKKRSQLTSWPLLSMETGLNIQIAHAAGMSLDKAFARINRVAHEHIEGPVCFGSVFHRDKQQGAVLRVHGRFP